MNIVIKYIIVQNLFRMSVISVENLFVRIVGKKTFFIVKSTNLISLLRVNIAGEI